MDKSVDVLDVLRREINHLGTIGANDCEAGLTAARDAVRELMEASEVFVNYEKVRAVMGGTTPKSGALWATHSAAGDAEITVEDMQRITAALAACRPAPSVGGEMNIEIRGTSEVTPQLLATLFWNMDSDQQAEFFASLERIAGVKLCMQMAYVVGSIAERAKNGDRDAQNGFQTMLAHAKDYTIAGIESGHWRAKHAIQCMRDAAR